jgi:hypothetical protein
LSVTYTTATGRYWREGHTIRFRINIAFKPTFTTASGKFRIGGLPYSAAPTAKSTQFHPAALHTSSLGYTWGASATQITGWIIPGQTYVELHGMGNGIIHTTVTAAEVTSGATITIYISGEYEAGG